MTPAPAPVPDDDSYRPTYDQTALQNALIAERAREAGEVHTHGEDDPDLAVHRRFIAALEACQASGRLCPPRLDDPPWSFPLDDPKAQPPLDTPLRFDLADWRKIADELFGRACACRTLACVDSVGVAIDDLEGKPMPDVRGDEQASLSITRARECLFRLRGKH